MAKKKVTKKAKGFLGLKLSTEVTSTVVTFLSAFLPIFIAQLGTVDWTTALEGGAIVGILMSAMRVAVKLAFVKMFGKY